MKNFILFLILTFSISSPLTVKTLLDQLQKYNEQINSISSKIGMIMSTPNGRIGQKGKFWFSFPGKTRIDFTTPVKQSTVFINNLTYYKGMNDVKYKEISDNKKDTSIDNLNDMYLFKFLKDKILVIETNKNEINILGYDDKDKTKKTFWGKYDPNLKLINEFKIFQTKKGGLYSHVVQLYKSINGIPIAYKISAETSMGGYGGSIIIELKDIKLNINIPNSIWNIK